MKISIFLFLLVFPQIIFSQSQSCKIDRGINKILEKSRIDENKYISRISLFFVTDDDYFEPPIFSDEGSIDDLSQSLIDENTGKKIYTNPKIRNQFRIKILPCNLTIENNKLIIKGYLKGWKGSANEMFVFAGIKKDTIRNLVLSPSPHYSTVYYNGKEIKEPTIIREFPSFTLKRLKYSRTKVANNNYRKGYFEFQYDIEDSSVLIFSLYDEIAEIFDINLLIKQLVEK